jgi:hypothetical protein
LKSSTEQTSLRFEIAEPEGNFRLIDKLRIKRQRIIFYNEEGKDEKHKLMIEKRI